MYEHRIIRFNYTTYDVRRAQDVINPGTSHCNIMVLRAHDKDADPNPQTHFKYGRVIGIYHINVVYSGPGMINYNPSRINFLWVRWYDQVVTNRTTDGSHPYYLDQLSFPHIATVGAFGFIDPADVVRSSHIIPMFRSGRCYPNAKGLSMLARDSRDYKCYYIGRWVASNRRFCITLFIH